MRACVHACKMEIMRAVDACSILCLVKLLKPICQLQVHAVSFASSLSHWVSWYSGGLALWLGSYDLLLKNKQTVLYIYTIRHTKGTFADHDQWVVQPSRPMYIRVSA